MRRFCHVVEIANHRGLHARAAAKFVAVVESFDAVVTVQKGDLTVSGRSIMGLMLLAASLGSEIKLCATGAEAGQALVALIKLVRDKFDEL